jgi:hypothetical protein
MPFFEFDTVRRTVGEALHQFQRRAGRASRVSIPHAPGAGAGEQTQFPLPARLPLELDELRQVLARQPLRLGHRSPPWPSQQHD